MNYQFTFVCKKFGLIVLLPIAAIGVAIPALANPPQTIPPVPVFGVPTPVATLNAGDKATITVLLTTFDPNENGEGEFLQVAGAGSLNCTITDTTYFVPLIAECGPLPANAVPSELTAVLVGYDGDESGTVAMQINTTPTAQKTPNQIATWQKSANDYSLAAVALDARAIACEVFSALPMCQYSSQFESAALLDKSAAAYNAMLAADPPDANFTQIFQPVAQYFPAALNANGVPQGVTSAFNAWLMVKQQETALAQAAATSLNRASGALIAGNTYWQDAQIKAASKYAYELGAAMKEEPGVAAAFNSEFNCSIPDSSGDITE